MFTYAKRVLEKIGIALKKKYPQNIIAVIAFGSRIRGDHTGESDFDVLVIVNERSKEIEEGIIDVFVGEEMNSGVCFDPVIKTEESFELEKRNHTPFYENIVEEGVPL